MRPATQQLGKAHGPKRGPIFVAWAHRQFREDRRVSNVRAVVWAGCFVLLAACSGCGADAPTIDNVYGDPESTKLSVSVNTCNRNPSVDAEETTTEVRLTVTADEPSGDGQDDCQDYDDLTLETPLGDRIVVDDSTGDQIEVAPAEE